MFYKKPGRKERQVMCLCDCGSIKNYILHNVVGNKSKSCGCLNIEKLKHRAGLGNQYRKEYTIWLGIKKRCCNINEKSYINYGGRGIKICDSWVNSFENFFNDMGKRPSLQHSIDRIDVNGDYCKENCRWATKKEQMNNTRRNVYYNIDGQLYTLSYIAEKYNISYKILYDRTHKCKMSLIDALNYKKICQ